MPVRFVNGTEEKWTNKSHLKWTLVPVWKRKWREISAIDLSRRRQRRQVRLILQLNWSNWVLDLSWMFFDFELKELNKKGPAVWMLTNFGCCLPCQIPPPTTDRCLSKVCTIEWSASPDSWKVGHMQLGHELFLFLLSSDGVAILHALMSCVRNRQNSFLTSFSSADLLSFQFLRSAASASIWKANKALYIEPHLSSSCFQFSLYYSFHCIRGILYELNAGLLSLFTCFVFLAVHLHTIITIVLVIIALDAVNASLCKRN